MLQKTKEVLELIANDELFVKFDIKFVGGTALSYLINHMSGIEQKLKNL
jgi:hypothetical protein